MVANQDITGAGAQENPNGNENQDQFRLLFSKLTIGCALHEIILDQHGKPFDYRFIEINPAFEKLTGLQAEHTIGKTVREVIPTIEDFWIERYGRVALTGTPVIFENYSSGLDKTYEVLAYRTRPGQFAVLFSDISKHKQAEQILARESDRAIALLDLYQKAPFLSDQQLYDFVVEKAVSLTHSTIGFLDRVMDDQKTIIFTSWNQNAHAKCSASYNRRYSLSEAGNWADCIRQRAPVVYNNYAGSPNRKGLPEGHVPVKRFMSIPVMDNVKVKYIIGVGNKHTDYNHDDITHFKLVAAEFEKIFKQRAADEAIRNLNIDLENKVQERTAQLSAANQELEAFAYSVSHDLRAPLRAIEGFSQALMEDHAAALEPSALEYLKRVSSEAQRMARLIDDILKLSRLSRMEIHTQPVNLSAMVLEILKHMQQVEPDRRIEIIIAENADTSADPNLIRQALENLLSNAWKFTSNQDSARIEFGVHPDQDNTFFIKDNGTGFDMKYAEKLFTPFQRLHSITEFPGTGIGLSFVKNIIAKHGGRVWCESARNQGATFFFSLHHAN